MWEFEFSAEAYNYLIDSRGYTVDILQAFRSLTYTKEGIPPEGVTQIEPGVCLWETLNHLVIYERIVERSVIRVSVIKPKE